MSDKSIAIIGGGVAGLTAGYLLHGKYDVTLFEKSGRIGGNAYTLTTPDGQDVDIAATVFGSFTYKNLFRLFRKLNIETIGAVTKNPFGTFGLSLAFHSLDTKKGMYLTPGLKGLIAQRFGIFRPDHVASLLQVMRGLIKARTLFERGDLEGLSLEEALKKIPCLRGDAKLMLLCCMCLITSMHCDDVLDAPAGFFIEKLEKHNDLLPPKALLSVRAPKNGTKSYVDRLSAGYRDRIIFKANIMTVARRNDKVIIMSEGGGETVFDKVVFACNADQALRLLQEPTAEEKRLLRPWKYTEGRVVVHTDLSHFPPKELMEGYAFLYRKKARFIETSVSGSIWALPGVSKKCGLIATQHPNFPINEDRIVFEKTFRTPLFDFDSCRSIKDLPSLNGVRNTYYCGSHFGFGLHEDAVSSAIEVAKKLGVDF
jgi:uncharacterized protein